MTPQRIGFAGLGFMGEPMALNLLRAAPGLRVWNRSEPKAQVLREAGAQLARSPGELFAQTDTVFLMLATEAAMDEVLARGTPEFAARVGGHVIVHTGTTSPGYSRQLAADVQAAGGAYVEAPVSGSRKPAQEAQLVMMTAGPRELVSRLEPLMLSMARQVVHCGEPPQALQMKIAVNLFLITLVCGLAESFHMAESAGLDLALLRTVLDNGPMASGVSRMKLEKLVQADFSVQAAIADVLKNSGLVHDEARRLAMASPMIDASHALFGQAVQMGLGGIDMIGVIEALRDRTRKTPPPGQDTPTPKPG